MGAGTWGWTGVAAGVGGRDPAEGETGIRDDEAAPEFEVEAELGGERLR